MEIKKFSVHSHKLKALVYGKPGSGKTTLGGTCPNVIFASAEGGLLSLAGKNIEYVSIKSLNDLKELLVFLQSGDHKYETVVLDSITEINEIIKSEIEKKIGKSIDLKNWGEVANQIKKVIRGFRDLNMHVLFLALEKVEKDGDNESMRLPMLNGQSATDIAGFMDVVGYLYIDKSGERKITFTPSDKLTTKDRTNCLKPVLDVSTRIEDMKGLALSDEEVVYRSEEVKNEVQEKIEDNTNINNLKTEFKKMGVTSITKAQEYITGLGLDFDFNNLTNEQALIVLNSIGQK